MSRRDAGGRGCRWQLCASKPKSVPDDQIADIIKSSKESNDRARRRFAEQLLETAPPSDDDDDDDDAIEEGAIQNVIRF